MMKLSLARRISFCAAKFSPLLSTSKPNPPQLSPLRTVVSSPSSKHFRRLTSGISKPSESNLDQSRNNDDAEGLGNEELKKQIEKLYNGDANAFASVFETILRRKLSGKTDKLDEDLVNELRDMQREDGNGGLYEEPDSDSTSDDTDSGSDEDKLC